MKQETYNPSSIEFRNFDINKNNHIFTKAESSRLRESTIMYIAGNGDEERPDFIQHPIYMISENIQGIIDAYEDELIFKDVVLIHKESNKQFMYYSIIMDELDVKSDKTEYYPDGTEKRLILDKEKIGYHNLFLIKDSKMKNPIVSLNVVESILRRDSKGVIFEEVEVL